MKVKFKYGIKSFSGKMDEMVFANYENYGITIGRMLPEDRELTENQSIMGTRMQLMGSLWNATALEFKSDMAAYAVKVSLMPERTGKVGINGFSLFVMALYGASNDPESPMSLDNLSVDDLVLGSYTQIMDVKTMVENGYLPQVDGYEEYTASINA
jgi:hypothetical protein